MKRHIIKCAAFVWVVSSALIAQTSLAQDYSGVEKFTLTQLQMEIKDAKFLRGLNKTKDLIDNKHGCAKFADTAKKQRQPLINLQTEYQSKPVNDIYAGTDKTYRAAFSAALNNYGKCFDRELANFPYFVEATSIGDYQAFKKKHKTLTAAMATRGDLDTYIAMLDEQITFEKEHVASTAAEPSQIHDPLPSTSDQALTPSGPPPAITMDSAVSALTKMILAYHDDNPKGVFEKLSPSLQKKLFQNIDRLGINKGLYETISVMQRPYKNWKINCAACWEDTEIGNLCKLELNTYWVRNGGGHMRMFIVQNTTAYDDYSPRITSMYNWDRNDYKRFKKREGRVCKGFPYHFPE